MDIKRYDVDDSSDIMIYISSTQTLCLSSIDDEYCHWMWDEESGSYETECDCNGSEYNLVEKCLFCGKKIKVIK